MSDEKLDEFDFDSLEPIEIPVRYQGKRYILKEASGAAACQYRNKLLDCTKLGPEGKPSSIRGMADVEPLLVSLCLFEAESGKRVPVDVVQSFPSRMQAKLFAKVQEISELQEAEETVEELEKKLAEARKAAAQREDSAKNDSGPTLVGSD